MKKFKLCVKLSCLVLIVLVSGSIALFANSSVWFASLLVFTYCERSVFWGLGLYGSADSYAPIVWFTINVDGVSTSQLTVMQGEPFTPILIINDNEDPSPSGQAWISGFPTEIDPGEEGSNWIPIALGEEMILNDSDLYFVRTHAVDASGNIRKNTYALDIIEKDVGRKHINSAGSQSLTVPNNKSLKTAKVIAESKPGKVEVVIEHIEFEEDEHGVHAFNSVVLLGAAFDLSTLNKFYLSMHLLTKHGMLIYFQGNIRIGESSAEYLRNDNAWRITFHKRFEVPLDTKPDRFMINFTLDREHNRESFFRETNGIIQESNAIELLAERIIDE